MITKTETIVYNILEEKDLEDAVEKISGKKYKVSDMDVTTSDCDPLDSGPEDTGLYFSINIECEDDEIWDTTIAEKLGIEVTWDQIGLPEDKIFAFDVSKFKSYDRWTDNSD